MNFFFRAFFLFLFGNLSCHAAYYSQCGQDQFVFENYFRNHKGGTFVDIGAHNGVTYSNTFFLETEQNWSGICVEPIPEVFNELKNMRKCCCVEGCVTNRTGNGQLIKVNSPAVNTEMLSGLIDKYDPRHFDRMLKEIEYFGGTYDIIDVQCYLLNDLLEQNGISHVNFLSIDTEGGEFDILSSIDYSRFKIDVITVEDNYQDERFVEFLNDKGYNFVRRLGCDLLFVHKDLKPLLKRQRRG